MRRSPGPGPRHVKVVAVRHGPAEVKDPGRWPDDRTRPLTEEGVEETRRAARGLVRLTGPVDRIATSRAVRARRTAEIVRDALGGASAPERWPELELGHLVPGIFDRLNRVVRSGEQVVLVGHEPTLAEFVGLALTGEGIALARLGKAGALCLEFPAAVVPGAARLLWLLTRKQLASVRA